jgi:hypothetical protein
VFATWSAWHSALSARSNSEGWDQTYADPLPMEFADGKTRLAHAQAVAALSISDRQEAGKLLGDPLSCHVRTVPDPHCPTPEVASSVKLPNLY